MPAENLRSAKGEVKLVAFAAMVTAYTSRIELGVGTRLLGKIFCAAIYYLSSYSLMIDRGSPGYIEIHHRGNKDQGG